MGKFYFDTEFYERADHPTGGSIELISIGIISEDNRELYLECSEFDWGAEVDPWLEENVKPHLHNKGVPMDTIRKAVSSFIGTDPNPELWAYYASYDWVVLCWIFGRMIDLPPGFPRYVRDFRFLMDILDVKRSDLPKKPKNAHNAIADARWLKEAYEKVTA